MAARTLIIDTALGACTVLVAEGERITAVRSEIMARGHQERLGGLARDVIAEAGGAETIERVAVTVGPGSITGMRVGLAFAQGFGLARDVPLAGLGVLAALAASVASGPVAAVIDARRDQVYLGLFRGGAGLSPPEAVSLDAAVAHAGQRHQISLSLLEHGKRQHGGAGREIEDARSGGRGGHGTSIPVTVG